MKIEYKKHNNEYLSGGFSDWHVSFYLFFLQVSCCVIYIDLSGFKKENSIYHVDYVLMFDIKPSLFSVLSKLLTTLNESDNKLSGEQEMSFLQTLLQSKEINALVNVHHKVAKMGKDDRVAPILSASMQVN